MDYQIKRGDTLIATITPTGSQKRAVMGQDTINVSFTLNTFVQFAIWDTLTAFGKTYILNKYPQVEKVSGLQYNYTAEFDAQGYDLGKVQYMFLDDDDNPEMSDFPLTADAGRFVDLIVSNMNRASDGWSKGTVDATDYATLSFSNDSCLSALSKVANQFQTEFWIDDKTINVTKQGQETELIFKYGKGNGLYSIQRAVSNDKDIFSRLYVFGSNKNLPSDYRGGKTRLQLPGTLPYIQKDDQFTAYGLIETTQIFDGSNNTKEIYPHRTGTISAITDAFTFTDSDMDFDVNAQLVSGVDATVHFQTGDLAGYDFTINSYNNSTKTFVINQFKDETGMIYPDASGFKPAVGDTYVLLNINMPDTYVTAAENDLQDAGNDYYDINSNGREIYTVDCDPLYFKDQNLDTLNLGDFVEITDTPMGLDKSIRMIGIERDLQLPFKYTLTLADTATVALIVRQYFEDQTTQIIIQMNKLNDVARARRNWRNTADLEDMVFDPEGNYYTDKIKPASIETLYLAVGAKAQNFSLNAVVIQPNKGGDASKMDISAGELVHYTLEITDLGSVWEMVSASFTDLVDATAYYLFARVSTSALTGTWVLKTSPVLVDSETGYWNLGVGILFAVEDGYRNFEFNKGMTYIVGDTIKTGRIQSIDAQNYFDLTQGKFNLGSASAGLDWDVTTPDTLTIRGAVNQNPGGATDVIGVFRGDYDPLVTYYNGDSVTYKGSLWRYIYDSPLSGIEPTLEHATYWKLIAAAGAGGDPALRIIYNRSDSPDTPPDLDLSDPDPENWLTQTPETDVFGILTTEDGDYLVTDTDDEVITSTAGQYIWMSVESKGTDGNFISWSKPSRVTGLDGFTGNYTELRFAKNGSTSAAPPLTDNTAPDPSGWSTTQPTIGVAEYLWVISAIKSADGVTMISTWSMPARMTGIPGPQGADGADGASGSVGPYLMYRGVYDNTKTYHGGSDRLEAVYYGGLYYVSRIDAGNFSGLLPINASKWNVFSGQFESIATGLLLAQLAYVNNLVVGRLSTSADAVARIVAAGAELDVFDSDVAITDEDPSRAMIRMGKGAGIMSTVPDAKPGIALRDTEDDDSYTENSSEGLFSNGSGIPFLPSSSNPNTNATIAALLTKRSGNASGISAAVVGIDQTSSGDGESWGGFFNTLRSTGDTKIGSLILDSLRLHTSTVTADYVCDSSSSYKDFAVMCYNTSTISVTLPVEPTASDPAFKGGRLMLFKRANPGGVSLRGDSTHQLFGAGGTSTSTTFGLSSGKSFLIAFWDGSFWNIAEI